MRLFRRLSAGVCLVASVACALLSISARGMPGTNIMDSTARNLRGGACSNLQTQQCPLTMLQCAVLKGYKNANPGTTFAQKTGSVRCALDCGMIWGTAKACAL